MRLKAFTRLIVIVRSTSSSRRRPRVLPGMLQGGALGSRWRGCRLPLRPDQLRDFPGPVMRCRRLQCPRHMELASRRTAEPGGVSAAGAQRLGPMHHAVDLKHVLREIKSDRGNFAHGRLPLGGSSTATAIWHLDAGGGSRPQHHYRTSSTHALLILTSRGRDHGTITTRNLAFPLSMRS